MPADLFIRGRATGNSGGFCSQTTPTRHKPLKKLNLCWLRGFVCVFLTHQAASHGRRRLSMLFASAHSPVNPPHPPSRRRSPLVIAPAGTRRLLWPHQTAASRRPNAPNPLLGLLSRPCPHHTAQRRPETHARLIKRQPPRRPKPNGHKIPLAHGPNNVPSSGNNESRPRP
jgi:hypothetical protein